MRQQQLSPTNLLIGLSRFEENLVVELLDQRLVLVVLNQVLRALQYQSQASLKVGRRAKEI